MVAAPAGGLIPRDLQMAAQRTDDPVGGVLAIVVRAIADGTRLIALPFVRGGYDLVRMSIADAFYLQ
jgi:hypothetical protein